jgi:hypothetical protein
MTADQWLATLRFQLDLEWTQVLRSRFEGLTDDEYRWEPVAGCWNIRPTGDGRYTVDWEQPEPQPPPVTTIGWRLCHMGATLATRVDHHFGPRSLTLADIEWPGTASGGLDLVERAYAGWCKGLEGLGEAGLERRSEGPPGTLDGRFPFADVIQHVNRHLIQHGAEVALLRDLYRARFSRS